MQYGMGYVEFLSLKKEIEAMLSDGYRIAAIYRKLVSGKKITMSYTTFSRYVSGRYLKKEGKKDENAVPDSGKSATAALPAVPEQANPPATSEQASPPARSGPRIVGGQKPVPFGEIKIDLDKAYGIESEKE